MDYVIKMKPPMVSIITPTYNSAKYLEETILSVRDQTYQNIEHIIIDGCSEDGTREIIEKYSHIKFISEPDDGMYSAINKGLRIAKGSIIAYLNSDDLYFPDTVETIVNNYKLTKPYLYIGYCEYIDHNGDNLYTYRYLEVNRKEIESLGRMPFAQQAVFWDAKIMREVGYFNQDYHFSADYDFFYKAIKKFDVIKIRKKLAKFRMTPNQLSQFKIKHNQEHQRINYKHGINPSVFRKYLYELRIKIYNIKGIINKLIHKYILRKNYLL